jgi:arsenite methyltransferase
VIYRGPFAKVYDDENHVFIRGQRMAVCERSYNLLTGAAYADQFIGIAPVQEITPQNWCHDQGAIRAVTETKGSAHKADSGSCC